MNGAGEPDPGGGGYKRRYRALKRRLKFLIYVRRRGRGLFGGEGGSRGSPRVAEANETGRRGEK